MKKYILIFALLVSVVLSSTAQFTVGVKMPQTTSDSIKTGALTVTKYLTLQGGYESVSIATVVTKVSGTVAGTVYIAGTVDGTNYTAALDSLTLSNVTTNHKIFMVTGNPYWKYKIWGVGSGTMNGVLTVWYLARKHN